MVVLRGSRYRRCWLTLRLLTVALAAKAIPAPPPAPPTLRQTRMTVHVRLVEANNGEVSRLSKLCTVSGTVPVYADDGRATAVNAREIAGCSLRWKGQDLHVSVRGAVAIGKNRVTFATAQVSVVPPDARPLCPDICGPQPLADSAGDITVSRVPRSIKFSLLPNPVSLLNAKPTVWLEADVVVGD